MNLIPGDFHQEDFSYMAKLKPTEEATIRITNEYQRSYVGYLNNWTKKTASNSLKKSRQRESLSLGQILNRFSLKLQSWLSFIKADFLLF